MDSSLNSAHYHRRRADKHLQYGRYDDAIRSHKEIMHYLTKAMTESTIPENIKHLEEQRNYHDNIQIIILRQKNEFERYVQRNGLKFIKTEPKTTASKEDPLKWVKDASMDIAAVEGENRVLIVSDLNDDDDNSNEFFSLVSELKIDLNEPMDSKFVKTAVHAIGEDSDSDEYLSIYR